MTRKLKFSKKLFLLFLFIVLCNNSYTQTCPKAINFGGNNTTIVHTTCVDVLGNTYVAGRFTGLTDFDPGPGTYTLYGWSFNSDAFICKYDASLNLIWAKHFGDGGQGSYVNDIALDAGGNIYATGIGSGDFDPGPGTTNLSVEFFINKLDPSGNFVWIKSFGGSFYHFGKAITVDGSNLYVAGTFTGSIDFDPGPGTYSLTSNGNNDICVLKFDLSGNLIWGQQIGGTGNDIPEGISLDPSANLLITGTFSNSVDFDPGVGVDIINTNGGTDAFVCKLNSSGNYIWAKGFGGNADDASNSVISDVSGNILTTGFFGLTADFDPGASTQNLTAIWNSSPSSQVDIFVSKLDPNGNYVWAKNFGGPEIDKGKSITLDGSGNVYTTGYFKGSFPNLSDFDPGPATYSLSDFGYDDIFISKLNAAGNFVWAKSMGGGGASGETGESILVDTKGIIVSGSFGSYTGDFDPDDMGTYTLTHSNFNTVDGFIVRFPSLTFTSSTVSNVSCFGGSNGSASVTIIDGYNPLSYSWNTIPSQSTSIASNLSAGAYSVTVTDFNGCSRTQTILVTQPADIALTLNKTNESCVGGGTNGSATVSVTGGIPPYSYSWNSSTTNTNNAISGLAAGTYSVLVTDANNCTKTSTVIVTKDYNSSVFTYSTNAQVATFSITGIGCNSFLWDFGNGNTSSLNSNPTVTYASPGIYSVCLQCNSQPSSCVRCMTISVPSNGSGGIGIEEFSNNNKVLIYPNPFNQSTTLLFTNIADYKNCSVKLFDLLGRQVFNKEVKEEKTEIERNNLKDGIYFFQLESSGHIIGKGKIIIN